MACFRPSNYDCFSILRNFASSRLIILQFQKEMLADRSAYVMFNNVSMREVYAILWSIRVSWSAKTNALRSIKGPLRVFLSRIGNLNR